MTNKEIYKMTAISSIIVRESRAQIHKDINHKYNIYIPYLGEYINVYTCVCCQDTFITYPANISEPDTGVTINDVPTEVLKHWLDDIQRAYTKHDCYKILIHTLQDLIKKNIIN